MQADEIIQQKEWWQLSDEEKVELAPLAATEGEYNVLKKMLLVVAEEKDAVPLIAPDVQSSIKNEWRKPQRKRYWLPYAAAAVIIFAAAGLFLFRPSPKQDALVRNDPKPTVPISDTAQRQATKPLQTEDRREEQLAVAGKDSLPVTSPSLQQQPPVIDPNPISTVSTTVASAPALLDFVTEVY